MADLVEGLAHDLKNQLTVVAASVQLARQTAEGSAPDLLDRAFDAAMRAAGMLDEMLRYTRHGAVSPQAQSDVAEVLETAVAAAWTYCAARRVALEMWPAPGLPPVRAPAAALRVLCWRLLCTLAEGLPAGGSVVAVAEAMPDDVVLQLRVHPAPRPARAVADRPEGAAVPYAQTAAGARPAAGLAVAEERTAYGVCDEDEQALIQALAGQAGAVLRWEPDGAVLTLAEVAPRERPGHAAGTGVGD
jgi:hypothetical protein